MGRIVPDVNSLTMGVLKPDTGSTWDKAVDHNGQRKSYGGKACQVWASTMPVVIKHMMAQKTLSKTIVLNNLFTDISELLFNTCLFL